MHIILVSDRLATARSITLTWRHAVLFAGAIFTSVLLLSSLFSYMTVRHAAEVRLPFLQDLLRAVNAEETRRSKDFVQENLNAMAVKLGEMQAQLLRLDTIGERLAGMAGVKPQDLKAFEAKSEGRGGPLVLPSALSPTDLQRAVDALANQVEAKSDAISLIESQMLELKKIFGSRNDRLIKQYSCRLSASTRWSRGSARCRRRCAGRDARRAAARSLRRRARGRQARAGHAPLRRAADRRHGAARGQDRRDAHRRGQDAGRDAAGPT
jgi:hypothetical protein